MRKTALLLSLLSLPALAELEIELEDFSKNSVSVVSVSEGFANKVKSEGEKNKDKMESFLESQCSQEIKMLCQNVNLSNYNCLRDNFNLTTGSCRSVLQEEFKKGISLNRLSVHDLKLTQNTKFLGKQETIGFTLVDYQTDEVFDYRGLRFRKGFLKARNYKYEDYNGQYVIFSGKPLGIFKDSSGIEFNPAYQKGPFFFDSNGKVKIGSLSKNYEYKKKIILKQGTVVAFDDSGSLVKGILAKSVRIGKCGFISGMDISDKQIEECQKQ